MKRNVLFAAALVALASLFLPTVARAQSLDTVVRPVFAKYDLDALAITYCVLSDPEVSGTARIKTTGSTTTIDAVSGAPFADLAVNDVITVVVNSIPTTLVIRTWTSNVLVVVDTAINLDVAAGYAFTYRKLTCGTGAGNGWFNLSRFTHGATLSFSMDQVNVVGGIDVRVECQLPGPSSQPIQVFPSCPTGACGTVQNYTTAGIASRTALVINEAWEKCRVGLLIHTADDGGDTGANAESLTSTLYGRK